MPTPGDKDAAETTIATFDLPTVVRFCDLAVEALAAAREEIDALNVYPVPDGDTGTNMFLTLEAGRDAMRAAIEEHGQDLRAALTAFGRGALLGARGNSGVILAQLLGQLARTIGSAGPGDRSATVFADALVASADAAYTAVAHPVEGTILSVSRAAADAATHAAADPDHRLRHVITATAEAAREALARTPEQLQVLADAGVVDAGGRGLCVILDAAETALTGRRPSPAATTWGTHRIPLPNVVDELSADGPAYEVMYLLEADDDRIPRLREALDPLGDSLVVVGGDRLWNIHVHVDDVGAAIEAGIEAGRPYRVRVTHFAEQTAARTAATRREGRAVVAVAAGDGLEALFAEAGATVVPGGPGRRPSTAQILEAIEATNAAEVVVLPNDKDTLGVAEIAARTAEEGGHVKVAVVSSQTQVQGLAALAVHEPGRAFDADLVAMASAAKQVRHGAVTVASRQAMTSAGPCEAGDALGVVGGDFAIVGGDLADVALQVVERLLGAGGELVTLVAGQDGRELAEVCERHVVSSYPSVDVVVYDGGQDRYPLLVGVE